MLRNSRISLRYCRTARGLFVEMARCSRICIGSKSVSRYNAKLMSMYSGRWSPFPSVLYGSMPDAVTYGCSVGDMKMKSMRCVPRFWVSGSSVRSCMAACISISLFCCTHAGSFPLRSYICSFASMVIITVDRSVVSSVIRCDRSRSIICRGSGFLLSSVIKCLHC